MKHVLLATGAYTLQKPPVFANRAAVRQQTLHKGLHRHGGVHMRRPSALGLPSVSHGNARYVHRPY
jgi:hypothetical protein